jgi:hypothetical protein
MALKESEELRDLKYSWRGFAFRPPTRLHDAETRRDEKQRFTNRATSAHEFESNEGSGTGQLANKRVHRIIFSPKLSRGSQAVDLVTCE